MAVIALVALALALLTAAGAADAAVDPPADACVACHEEDDDETVSNPVPEWRHSVHAAAEVSCDGCHGGDPHAVDEDAAHDEDAGFIGTPGWREMPPFCGACHESIAEAFEGGAFGSAYHGDAVPPSCATCHMSEGHDTQPAELDEILPDPLPPRLRRAPVVAESRDALRPLAEREHAVAVAVAALARRALPPTDLDLELARLRGEWLPRFHRFEPVALADSEPRSLAALGALEARTASLEQEAGRRGRLGVAGLAAFGALFALLGAARRRALR
jgi:hypothetical protein